MNLFFEGTISVKSVLEQAKRECIKLYVNPKKQTRDFRYILSLAKQKKVPIQMVDKTELDALSPTKKHGGILLEAGMRQNEVLPKNMKDVFFYVNGVEDPYNFGSLCRTLYAMGISSLVILNRDWYQSEAVIQKASAGAYEKMDIYTIDNDQQLVDYCQSLQIPLYCAHRDKAVKLTEMKWPNVFCLAVGGALRGLSSVIVQSSNQNIYIPYGNDFRNALDTPGAISIFAYEIKRSQL